MTLLLNSTTPLSLWHEMIHEAESVCETVLKEELESYLVFLLMRFTNKPQFSKHILATEFLAGLKKPANQQEYALQNVGDQCLIYTGLFPKHAVRRHVKVSYFINLGQSAYSNISRTKNDLYSLLSNHFVSLMDILQAMRQYSKKNPDLLPLEAYDLWQETGSKRALTILKQYTNGTPLMIDIREKSPKR